VSGVTLNQSTLEITVAPTVMDNTEIILTIKYNGTTVATPILKVGFNIPKLGDFAYADGSFSAKYNASKAIGYVYKCEETSESGTYQVSIMSLKPIETSQLGYSEPRSYIEGWESNLYKIITKYNAALNSNLKIIDKFPKTSSSSLTNCENISSITTDDVIKYQGEGTIEEYEDDIMM